MPENKSIQVIVPNFSELSNEIPETVTDPNGTVRHPRREFMQCAQWEVWVCVESAMRAKQPEVRFSAQFRRAGSQHILEFEVFDRARPERDGAYNWHGQNTSQWVYAGCILWDDEDNRISTHH